MRLFENILGPRSKYDQSIPYTYEARFRIFEGGGEYNSCFSDTICGLVEYLNQCGIKPDEVEVFEIYQDREFQVDATLFTSPDREWLFRPDICRAFEQHYKGHIQNDACTFKDRDRRGSGP